MMRILIAALFFVQLTAADPHEPVGTYNPEEDKRIENEGSAIQWFKDLSDKVDARFGDSWIYSIKNSIPIAYRAPLRGLWFVIILLALYFLHKKVLFRRKRENADVNKVASRYERLIKIVAALMVIIMLKASLIWGVVFLGILLLLVPFCLTATNDLCPSCCCDNKPEIQVEPTRDVRVEICDTKASVSQYLKLDEITEESAPKRKCSLYLVEKRVYTYTCPECGYSWEEEKWVRIQTISE